MFFCLFFVLFLVYHFLWMGSGEEGAGLFSFVTDDRMRKKNTKMHQESFRLDITKKLFSVKIILTLEQAF